MISEKTAIIICAGIIFFILFCAIVVIPLIHRMRVVYSTSSYDVYRKFGRLYIRSYITGAHIDTPLENTATWNLKAIIEEDDQSSYDPEREIYVEKLLSRMK